MEIYLLLIIGCLFIMPLGAALNIEIEKPARKKGIQPQDDPKTPDGIRLLPGPGSSRGDG